MTLDSTRYRLWNAYQTLMAAWDDAARLWTDAVRREFFQKHVAGLGPSVFAALAAIDKLGQTLAKAQQDCSESAQP